MIVSCCGIRSGAAAFEPILYIGHLKLSQLPIPAQNCVCSCLTDGVVAQKLQSMITSSHASDCPYERRGSWRQLPQTFKGSPTEPHRGSIFQPIVVCPPDECDGKLGRCAYWGNIEIYRLWTHRIIHFWESRQFSVPWIRPERVEASMKSDSRSEWHMMPSQQAG